MTYACEWIVINEQMLSPLVWRNIWQTEIRKFCNKIVYVRRASNSRSFSENRESWQACRSMILLATNNFHIPTRSLCSANNNLLSVPRVRTTFASRGFSVAAPTVWNSLPSGIRNSSSTHTFRRLLKTHSFQQAFGSPKQLTQVPQIRPLADTVHSKHLFTYLFTLLVEILTSS